MEHTQRKGNSNIEPLLRTGLIPLTMRSLTGVIIMVMTLSVGLLVKPVFALELVTDVSLVGGLLTGKVEGQLSVDGTITDRFPSTNTGGIALGIDFLLMANGSLRDNGAMGLYTGLIYTSDTTGNIYIDANEITSSHPVGELGANISLPLVYVIGTSLTDKLLSLSIGGGIHLAFGDIRTGFGFLGMLNASFSLPNRWIVSLRVNAITYFNRETFTTSNSVALPTIDNALNDPLNEDAEEFRYTNSFLEYTFLIGIGKRFSLGRKG